MTSERVDEAADLSLSAERRIDGVCVAFEQALRAEKPARIEEYVEGVSGPEHTALLRELLRLEVAYRSRRGEQPSVDEYRSRFPAHAHSMASWFPSEPTISCVAPATSATNGPTVAGYEIVAELGRGGMGVVYKARHVKFERLVALKMILAGAHGGAEHTERFLAEGRAVARLQNPHIVQIHEIGDIDGLPYFSLEYVDGGNLAARLKGAPPSDMEAARLVDLLARTVHYAHGRGIVHRDLKPANILLTSDGVPKIADFGLAKFLDKDAAATRTGLVVGTPSYMAPEQATGKPKEIGPAVDVYALGAILYELLTGRPPFRGETMLETLRMVEEQAPHPPHVFNPRVDRALEAICLKCLQKAPADRYLTAEALADDLAAFLRGESVQAHSGTATRLLGVVLKETRYTEVMRLWSSIWMGLAVNAFVVAIGQSLLIWYAVQDFAPYMALGLFKMCGDVALAWFFRVRGGAPALPVERQLVQIWVFFWLSHFLIAWLYQKSGAPIAGYIPILDMEMAVVLGSMAAILGGSFYVSAALCVVKALLETLWPGIGGLFAAFVICPYFFGLGWKHSRRRPVN